MKKFKYISIFLILILFFILILPNVSAGDLNSADDIEVNNYSIDNSIKINNDFNDNSYYRGNDNKDNKSEISDSNYGGYSRCSEDIISSNYLNGDVLNNEYSSIYNHEISSEYGVYDLSQGSFTDLYDKIKNGGEYNLTKNYTYDSAVDSNFKNSLIIKNNLTINGNGFTIDGNGEAKIFEIGSDSTLKLNNMNLINTYAINYAIIRNNGTVLINNCSFVNYVDSTASSLALFAPIYSTGNLIIDNSSFKNSKITHTGTMLTLNGGIIENYKGNLTIKNSIFENNTIVGTEKSRVTINGALIYNNAGNISLNNVNFTKNYVFISNASTTTNVNVFGFVFTSGRESNLTISKSKFESNAPIIFAKTIFSVGTIRNSQGNVNINDSKFIENKAFNAGGISNVLGNLIVTNTLFSHNSASNCGGAIFNDANLTLINNTFELNSAKNDGGAIHNYGQYDTGSNASGNMYIENNRFISNWVETIKTSTDNLVLSQGGAIYTYSGNLTIKNTNFTDNKAIGGNGGALANKLNNFLDITGSIFESNLATQLDTWPQATGLGGAIFLPETEMVNLKNPATFNVNYSIFENNSAVEGSAIFSVPGEEGISCDVVANNNWWGSNKPNFDNLIGKYSGKTPVFPNNFIIINITGSDFVSDFSDYNITMNQINTNGIISNLIGGYLPDYNVSIKSNNGILSPLVVTIHNGKSNLINYYAKKLGEDNLTIYNEFNSGILFKNINIIKYLFTTSVTNDYLLTVINGSVVISVISPNGTVNGGRIDLRKGGTLISTSELSKGKATLNIQGLGSGNYSVIIYYLGNDGYSGSSKTLNLEILSNNVISTTLTGSNYHETYGANKSFNVLLTDEQGNGLANQSINFQLINSIGETINYTTFTNGSGIANLIINLNVGEYNIVYSFNSIGDYIQSNGTNIIIITCNNAEISSDLYNTTKGSNFTTKLTGEKGKPIVGAEVKLTLYNQLGESKVYWRTTNIEGIAKLPINLMPGTWTIETSYTNNNYDIAPINQTVIVQTAIVSSVFSPGKYNETYGVNKNFTVNFKTNTGEAIVGKELKLTLYNQFGDSKVYWRTTNTEGIAKLPINLIPGVWFIESAFTGADYPNTPINQTVVVTPLIP